MFEIKEYVMYTNLDSSGRLSLRGVQNLYQDVATLHSQEAGYPMSWLVENKRGWVLTSYQTHLYRMPEMGELMTVKTASVNARGFIGYRLFFMEDEGGKLLSEGYSEWAFVNIEKMTPIRVTKEMMENYHIDDIPYDKWASRKIKLPEKKKKTGSFRVENFMLDTNSHMNNVYYVEACEALLDGYEFNHLRVEFKKSARLNDTVDIFRHTSSDPRYFSLETEDGSECFTCEFSRMDYWNA